MAVREILQIGHPVLASRAEEIPVGDIQSAPIQSAIEDMIDTMRDANGAGIAANQIGVPLRMFVIEVGDNPRYPYKPNIPLTIVINPRIEYVGDQTFVSNEGCLSVPQIRGNVNRHVKIKVSYYDRDAKPVSESIQGYSACTWQHEYDHLDGLLFPHRVSNPSTFCSWKIFQDFQQEAYATEVQALVKQWGG